VHEKVFKKNLSKLLQKKHILFMSSLTKAWSFSSLRKNIMRQGSHFSLGEGKMRFL